MAGYQQLQHCYDDEVAQQQQHYCDDVDDGADSQQQLLSNGDGLDGDDCDGDDHVDKFMVLLQSIKQDIVVKHIKVINIKVDRMDLECIRVVVGHTMVIHMDQVMDIELVNNLVVGILIVIKGNLMDIDQV